MGEIADDTFDAALYEAEIASTMYLNGCRRCPGPHENEVGCSICFNLGWLDKDGNPCEP